MQARAARGNMDFIFEIVRDSERSSVCKSVSDFSAKEKAWQGFPRPDLGPKKGKPHPPTVGAFSYWSLRRPLSAR